jgi:glucarate dehydratase
MHVVAATQWIQEPSQTLFRWQTDDVIEEGPFRPKNGVVAVPEGPGLGVTLSRQKLKYGHQQFLDEGPVDHYSDPLVPGRYRRLPLD